MGHPVTSLDKHTVQTHGTHLRIWFSTHSIFSVWTQGAGGDVNLPLEMLRAEKVTSHDTVAEREQRQTPSTPHNQNEHR